MERWNLFIKNNINYENYDGSQNALLIDKFIFYPATNKWQVKGKNVYYKSKGIEDFFKKIFIIGDKNGYKCIIRRKRRRNTT